MKLPGIVTNITNFGAFVDIGVHQDGLVHLSQLANHFVSDPHEDVKLQQQMTVTVNEVDEKRNRIGLTMKTEEKTPRKQSEKRFDKRSDKRQDRAPETDMAARLAALASKFK